MQYVAILMIIGSERARTAKTAGTTLAEAGKINESLMYLGQCLQMQSNMQDGNKVSDIHDFHGETTLTYNRPPLSHSDNAN